MATVPFYIFPSLNLFSHTKNLILKNPNIIPCLLYAITSVESEETSTNANLDTRLLKPALSVLVVPCLLASALPPVFAALGFGHLCHYTSWLLRQLARPPASRCSAPPQRTTLGILNIIRHILDLFPVLQRPGCPLGSGRVDTVGTDVEDLESQVEEFRTL